jgi:hypothetical protein
MWHATLPMHALALQVTLGRPPAAGALYSLHANTSVH